MNKSVLMIMGGALVFAAIVAVIVQLKLAPQPAPDNAPAGIEVLVASKAMAVGEILRPENVRWAGLPEGTLFKGVIKKSDQADENKLVVYDKPLRRAVEAGEPITQQAVIIDVQGGGNVLAISLAPGMRAVGVPVKAETTAGGFIMPGDYVDVILTYQVNLKGDASNYSDSAVQRFASETILSNVKVLAVDQSAKDDQREAKVARTVTVEVDKKGAQVLSMAVAMGDISLSLRRFGEKDTAQDQNTPLTTDVSTSKVIKKVYEIMDTSKANTVRLYSGSNVVNVPVRGTAGP